MQRISVLGFFRIFSFLIKSEYYAMFSSYFANNLEIRMLTPLTQKGLNLSAANPIDYAWMPVVLDAETEYGATLTDIENQCLAGLIVTTGDVEAEYGWT